MRKACEGTDARATEFDGRFVSDERENSRSVGNGAADDRFVGTEENWFAEACRQLYESKAGTALHYETGFEERSCQRYAAGSVRPPAYFLRALLRSRNGWTWLNAIMDGCTEPWWLEIIEARRIWRAIETERARK